MRFNRKYLLFIDQHGQPLFAHSLKELHAKAGGGRISKQYTDKRNGDTVHNGYVIGQRWFTAYQPIEEKA